MGEGSGQAKSQFREERAVRGQQVQGTRGFRKGKPLNVVGHTNMTEKIDHDKIMRTLSPHSSGSSGEPQKKARISKTYEKQLL